MCAAFLNSNDETSNVAFNAESWKKIYEHKTTTVTMKAHEYEREGRAINTDWAPLLLEGAEPVKHLIPEFSDLYDCFEIHDLFTPEECQVLIEAMEKGNFKKTNYPQKYRGNLRLQNFDEGLAIALWERMQDFFPDIIVDEEDGTRWEKRDLNTKWRCSKYYPPTRFQQHCDDCYTKDEQNQSFYTVNIYMNDDFDGGATRLYHYRKNYKMEGAVQPKPGKALIFRQPPTELLSHDGQEVSSGIKYLLRTDVMYEKLDD